MTKVSVKVIEGTTFEGKRYIAGEEYEIDEQKAKALGNSVRVLKEIKSPKVDKMVKTPEVSK